jgi:heme-degrading monooxygenase HmoA
MIAGIWRGVIPTLKRKKYLALLRTVALPEYSATPGNRGVWYLHSTEGATTRFERITFWDDYAAIERFAGENYEQPKHCDFDSDYLLEGETRVEHYEVYSTVPGTNRSARPVRRGVKKETARVWRGVIHAEKAEAYLAYLADFGFRDYESYAGYRTGYLLSRREEAQVHVLLLSFWNSRQSIVEYAGPHIEQAHYYAYDLECLIDPPPNVEHFSVLSSPAP